MSGTMILYVYSYRIDYWYLWICIDICVWCMLGTQIVKTQNKQWLSVQATLQCFVYTHFWRLADVGGKEWINKLMLCLCVGLAAILSSSNEAEWSSGKVEKYKLLQRKSTVVLSKGKLGQQANIVKKKRGKNDKRRSF